MTIELKEVNSIEEINERSQYCFIKTKDGEKVILSCPMDGNIVFCPHKILIKTPLTLSPSVIFPKGISEKATSQILIQECGHHFWVLEGFAIGLNELEI